MFMGHTWVWWLVVTPMVAFSVFCLGALAADDIRDEINRRKERRKQEILNIIADEDRRKELEKSLGRTRNTD